MKRRLTHVGQMVLLADGLVVVNMGAMLGLWPAKSLTSKTPAINKGHFSLLKDSQQVAGSRLLSRWHNFGSISGQRLRLASSGRGADSTGG